MNNFLIEVVYEPVNGSYMACFSDGQNVLLGANTYHDAVCEADCLDVTEYEM